jgi:hypothetical protein
MEWENENLRHRGKLPHIESDRKVFKEALENELELERKKRLPKRRVQLVSDHLELDAMALVLRKHVISEYGGIASMGASRIAAVCICME